MKNLLIIQHHHLLHLPPFLNVPKTQTSSIPIHEQNIQQKVKTSGKPKSSPSTRSLTRSLEVLLEVLTRSSYLKSYQKSYQKFLLEVLTKVVKTSGKNFWKAMQLQQPYQNFYPSRYNFNTLPILYNQLLYLPSLPNIHLMFY